MVIRRGLSLFASDQSGAAVIELLLALNLILVAVFAFIEFTIAVNQWNLAAKATQVGAQVASVSNPVDNTLVNWKGLNGQCSTPDPNPGAPIPSTCTFDSRCVSSGGVNGSCTTCVIPPASGGCYDAAAMGRIVC